ncbi:MAG: GNAT family N-acetyltransferase [Candidatus Heimdallarchaeota archaeon]|nr:GNAT family N-acetyltransferase [Candidatus Heimdallarchaeota archaeon]
MIDLISFKIFPLTDKTLDLYASISIAFTGTSIYQVKGAELIEVSVPKFHKDYDIFDAPNRLLRLFDVTNWRMILGFSADKPIAGAILAYQTAGVHMLENRSDLAVLWDLRLVPEFRGKGIGQRIFYEVEQWAKKNQCSELKIETQNNNVIASKFYTKMGCRLTDINYGAYDDIPEEIQFFYRKSLK